MRRIKEFDSMDVTDLQIDFADSLAEKIQTGTVLLIEPISDSATRKLLDENKSESRIQRKSVLEVMGFSKQKQQKWNVLFDAIACDAFDEILAVEDFLATIHHILKPKGKVFFTVRNTQHRSVIDELLEGSWRQNQNRRKSRRYYTKREIEKLLFRYGFEVDEIPSNKNNALKTKRESGSRSFSRIGRLQVGSLKNDNLEEFYTKHSSVVATKRAEENLPLTSIVIPTHNQLAYTRMCLDSIRHFTDEPYELIVVDNDSTDATVPYLQSLENVKTIFNKSNRGFPTAVNQGIELAVGEYILLLNNDTIVTTGWLRRMQEAIKREANVGLVGPCSNCVSGLQEVACNLDDLSCLDGFAWERGKKFSRRIRETERLVGFCLLVKREVIEKIGKLDERFGTGCFEDDDFCRRAILADYRAVIAEDSFVYHFGSVTFRNSNVDFAKLMRENRQKFEQKWSDDHDVTGKENHNRTRIDWTVKPSETGGLILKKKTCALSLCMIVRDNENTIEPCLKSIEPWVDEIIVVDTGSEDRTPEICEKYGARLFRFPWCDDFSRARNESLKYATGEWLFWMDSDDTIPEECGRKLKELASEIHDPNIMGYVMQVHCPGKDEENEKDVTIVDHVKMFRNRKDLRFEHRIHEQIIPAIRRAGGDVAFTDIYVVHSGSDRTTEGRIRKLRRDYKLLELDLKERPDHPFVLFNMGMTLADDERHEEAIRYLQRCVSVSQPNESHLRKAYALLIGSFAQANRHHQAWQCCAAGLNHFPDDKELLFRAAMLHQHFDRFQDAEKAYLRVISEYEDRHFTSIDADLAGYKSRHNLALVYEDMGKTLLAEEQWRLALDEHPQSRGDWRGLGECLLKQSKKVELQSTIRDLKTKHTLAPIGAILEARILENEKKTEEASLLLEKASRSFPNDIDIQNELCRVLFYHGTVENSEIALRKLLELDPKDAAAWHNLAVIYSREEKYQLAIEAFESSLKFRPDSESTRNQLDDLKNRSQ